MTDVRALLQNTLDAALSGDVRAYWRRKAKTEGEDPDEYIVYTLDGDDGTYADDAPLTRTANLAVRYYYRDTLLDTTAERGRISDRERQIAAVLQSAGFSLPSGYFDVGDIDDIGFGTTIFECYFGRVV